MYQVTKTYDHNLGLSACFRQPKATSHCRDPHGYPLSFKLTFESERLNKDNWVIDFGSLKPVKAWLTETFDHRTVLAEDDEALDDFRKLYEKHNFAPIKTLPFVGCEGFAKATADFVHDWLLATMRSDMVDRGLRLVSVECREHAANSAIYMVNK